MQRTVTVSVIGVSGKETVKGSKGVGKSLLCNRFVRGDFDDFFPEHCSVLSQTDFGGSPVINNDHWLYWGERQVSLDDSSGPVTIRVIEQTEFLDDETYEPIAGPSTSEPYAKRCCQIRLESRDKLMYIQKEQLGLEAEFDQHVLPDGKCIVDAFIFVFDSSRTEGRTFESQCATSTAILTNAIKTKKPVVIAFSQADNAVEEARRALHSLLSKKEFKSTHVTVVEVSALMNVNVDEVFVTAACLASRTKLRLKILPFSEALKIVTERNREPLGQLGKQLDPLPADQEKRMTQSASVDNRIPAEILLRNEARQAFEAYQRVVETEQRKERLEEEFEFLLSDTPQVTPGKPLQDVSIFLQGFSAYESLPPSQAAMVYDRFQHDLLKRAEIEFRECLLENVELFADVVRSSRCEFKNENLLISEREMLRIKEFLQDDFRYRQLSRLFELREK
ncbi:hypothetical protein OESDEN_07567 [Oesophagostomum dentatum]|uniref:Rho GTPase-activating protein 35-like FF domain-containing protein n=1 Tax=Oesophagostomum dentatum TaxID=61180 RepID=A0A0B1T5M2_OESDE|nr:hypothetical protein OESDEN_07567 [Oesophagostomum dentatum]